MSLWAYSQKFLAQCTCIFSASLDMTKYFSKVVVRIHTFTHYTVIPAGPPHQIFSNAYCPNFQTLLEDMRWYSHSYFMHFPEYQFITITCLDFLFFHSFISHPFLAWLVCALTDLKIFCICLLCMLFSPRQSWLLALFTVFFIIQGL